MKKNFIDEIARVTHTDAQTIRLAMQQGCEWGMAVQRPGSKRYTYIPYPNKIKELFNVECNSPDDSIVSEHGGGGYSAIHRHV